MTPYMTGADVANVCATAGRIAARAGSDSVVLEHFSAAVDRVLHGLEKPDKVGIFFFFFFLVDPCVFWRVGHTAGRPAAEAGRDGRISPFLTDLVWFWSHFVFFFAKNE